MPLVLPIYTVDVLKMCSRFIIKKLMIPSDARVLVWCLLRLALCWVLVTLKNFAMEIAELMIVRRDRAKPLAVTSTRLYEVARMKHCTTPASTPRPPNDQENDPAPPPRKKPTYIMLETLSSSTVPATELTPPPHHNQGNDASPLAPNNSYIHDETRQRQRPNAPPPRILSHTRRAFLPFFRWTLLATRTGSRRPYERVTRRN